MPNPPLHMETKVVGVRETLAALGELEPKLRREAMKSMRQAAAPLAQSISSALPGGPPLSGMGRGRLAYGSNARKVSVKTGGRKRSSGDEWPLVTARAVDAAAVLFDMAGRGSTGHTASGRALIAGLAARYGGASRAIWPAALRELPSVTKAVLDAAEAAAASVNRRLDVRAG